LRRLPAAEISFNYLGHIDAASKAGSVRYVHDTLSEPRAALARRTHLLEIDAAIIEGNLQITFSYDGRAHDVRTIERLADAFAEELRALRELCRASKAPILSAGDFPLASLEQAEISRLAAALG